MKLVKIIKLLFVIYKGCMLDMVTNIIIPTVGHLRVQ